MKLERYLIERFAVALWKTSLEEVFDATLFFYNNLKDKNFDMEIASAAWVEYVNNKNDPIFTVAIMPTYKGVFSIWTTWTQFHY